MNRPRGYLKGFSQSQFPSRILTFDSEAFIESTGDGLSEHTFRLAVGGFAKLEWGDGYDPVVNERSTFETDSPAEFWDWVVNGGPMRRRQQLAAWAHNIGYDLRLTAALDLLPKLGLSLKAYAIGERTSWFVWRRPDGASLILRDLYSFLPASLAVVGEKLRLQKTPLPTQTDDAASWFERCRQDVEITERAVIEVLSYLRSNDLGTLHLSSAGQAERAYRRRFMAGHRLLIHDDAEQTERERASLYTGRCEVFRHGRFRETLTEWDYENAYARIARDALLPVAYLGESSAPGVSFVRRAREAHRAGKSCHLYDCTIETTKPIAPYRYTDSDGEQRIAWPTGRFRSLLWDSEFSLADTFSHVHVERMYSYKGDYALREWANWILSSLESPETNELVRIMLKGWARNLIGRFSLRYPRWEEIVSEAPTSDLSMENYGSDDGTRGVLLQIGRHIFEQGALADGARTMPALTAVIMSEQRVNIHLACTLAGWENVFYVDTDSLFTNRRGSQNLEWAIRNNFPALDGLRVKGTYPAGELKGPRQLVLNRRPRAAGLPLSAQRVKGSRSEWEAEVWESLPSSLRSGRGDRVAVSERRYKLQGTDRRRKHLPHGQTRPFKVEELQ